MARAVEVGNLSVKYGSTQVLDNACLSVDKGQIYGLLGPSGCGKTTLVSCLLTLAKTLPGSMVEVFGHDVLKGSNGSGVPGANVGETNKTSTIFRHLWISQ